MYLTLMHLTFGRVVSVFTWASNLRLTYYNASIMQFNTCVINLLYPLQCGFLWPSMCTVHRSGDVQMQVLQSPELLKWLNSEESKVFQVKSLKFKLKGVFSHWWGHKEPLCFLFSVGPYTARVWLIFGLEAWTHQNSFLSDLKRKKKQLLVFDSKRLKVEFRLFIARLMAV